MSQWELKIHAMLHFGTPFLWFNGKQRILVLLHFSIICFLYFSYSSPHQIRMKEEKEILEHFAGVVGFCFPQRIIYLDIYTLEILILIVLLAYYFSLHF
jgi:hypothetical protein